MPAGERDFNQLDPGHCYNDSGCVYIYQCVRLSSSIQYRALSCDKISSRNVLRFIHYNYYLGRSVVLR